MLITDIPATTARARFDAGFARGYELATDGRFESVVGHPDQHYAAGHSRGVIWSLGDWQSDSAEAWNSYVQWAHECAPRLAAELVTVEIITS